MKKLPNDFIFGAAASAFQIEGAAFSDGKGANKHDFALRDKEISKKYKGSRLPDVCADFYHKYPEDIELFKELGINSFRYSVSWARIFPDGPDKINPKGIEFYNNLINALKEANIEPFMDLFHGDIPQWVIDRGGIINDDFILWYTKYAEVCFKEFGDRVKFWSTVNEPKLQVYGAYAFAFTPPYVQDEKQAMHATKNMLLAHFNAVKLCRQICPNSKIGAVHNMGKTYPATESERDVISAKKHDLFQHLFLHPMEYGIYPEMLLNDGEFKQNISADDIKIIKEAFVKDDFAGINYYTPCFSKYDENAQYGIGDAEPTMNLEADAYGFKNYPQGMVDLLSDCSRMYPDTEFYITENGYTTMRENEYAKPTTTDDIKRQEYLSGHIAVIPEISEKGINLKGYYYWSIMDCFEGSLGFGVDMGLIGIDYDTLERIPRDSFYKYKEIIKKYK